MRFNAAAVLSTALLAGAAHAQAEVKDAEASAAAVDSAVLPSFTVSLNPLLAICTVRRHPANLNTIAYQDQGRLRRAVHRRLGAAMEAIPREEGYEGSR